MLPNPYVGLMACTTFAILGSHIAYFHSAAIVLANSAVATVCVAIPSCRLFVTTGDVALTVVAGLDIGVPFGMRSLSVGRRRGGASGNCLPTAVIGRAGGEEFVVADIDTTPAPLKMAERLCDAIAAIPFEISASIGTSSVALGTGPATSAMQLIDNLTVTSDAAMYRAKRAGGNQVCHYSAIS